MAPDYHSSLQSTAASPQCVFTGAFVSFWKESVASQWCSGWSSNHHRPADWSQRSPSCHGDAGCYQRALEGIGGDVGHGRPARWRWVLKFIQRFFCGCFLCNKRPLSPLWKFMLASVNKVVTVRLNGSVSISVSVLFLVYVFRANSPGSTGLVCSTAVESLDLGCLLRWDCPHASPNTTYTVQTKTQG